MKDQSPLLPTEAELEILAILWEKNPASVREINDLLNTKRKIGYTTTLKMLQIMYRKGIVKRDSKSRTHMYTPAIQKGKTQNKLLGNLMNRAFKGSAASLVMQVLGNHQASPEELKEIRDLIDKIEQGDKQ